MKKINIFTLTLLIFSFILILGCTIPPIEFEESELKYILAENGNLIFERTSFGELLEEADFTEEELFEREMVGVKFDFEGKWEENCSKEYRLALEEWINSMVEEETDEKEKERINSIINKIDEFAYCDFKTFPDEKKAELRIWWEMDSELLEILRPGEEELGLGEIIKENEKHTVKIPRLSPDEEGISLEFIPTPGSGEALKIKIDGEVISLSHENYEREEEYYVFPGDVGETITIEYVPALFLPETGDGLGLDTEFIILAVIAIITLILLLGLIIFIKTKKGKSQSFKGFEEKKESEKEKPEEEQEDKQVKNRWNSAQVVEFDTVKSKKSETEAKKSDDELIEQKETPAKKTVSKELSESEQKVVERAVTSLQDKKSKYSKEQLMNVMQDMGYNENVAKEIVKQLYKD